ncbi:MAG TPA: SDR family oxidoreductase [Baekduia sp.]|uniref:SDR family NAD(P)-dependent oxidoreductase n=1 Tax=Baekduia sp. TaxID=2600305 RepID=UPI002D76E43B|nr:SDR family oxidoreductase [Baekduia sp.]HET6509076.1 SDR family oxidoreductase [Baekduia sp.]
MIAQVPQSFDGLAAIVTGGGSGIGLATATALAAAGARVAVLDLDAGQVPDGIASWPCDVADAGSVDAAVAGAAHALGGIDVLVNNAGVPAHGTITDNDDDEWRRVLDVNVLGMVRATRAAMPHLLRSDSAAIVNTCSIAATTGMPGLALYSATKGAVRALTFAMAADGVRHGIRVNCVSPATVDSPWLASRLEGADGAQVRARLEARQPTRTLVSTAEVAAAILFLAGPQARSTTGTELHVDCGVTHVRLA